MKKEITLNRVLDVAPERVWRAFTDADEVKQWWGPDGVTIPECDIELKVGGALYIVMLAGDTLGPLAGARWPMKGMFEEIIKPEKLVFSNNAVDEAGNVLLTGTTSVTLEAADNGTYLTVTTSAEGTAPGTEQMIGGMEQGWNQQLDKLVQFLA